MTKHLTDHNTHSQNLIRVLGIESLPEDQKARILTQVSEVIEQRLFIRLLDALPDEKREQFKQLMEAENAVGIQTFIEKEVPLFLTWVEEETNKIKEELNGLGVVE